MGMRVADRQKQTGDICVFIESPKYKLIQKLYLFRLYQAFTLCDCDMSLYTLYDYVLCL